MSSTPQKARRDREDDRKIQLLLPHGVIPIKQKPLLPTLRDKKRYILFEVKAQAPCEGKAVADAIKRQALAFLGEYGVAQANFKILNDAWNEKQQRGIVSVQPKYVDHAKATLMLVKETKQQPVTLKTLRTTGVINKIK